MSTIKTLVATGLALGMLTGAAHAQAKPQPSPFAPLEKLARGLGAELQKAANNSSAKLREGRASATAGAPAAAPAKTASAPRPFQPLEKLARGLSADLQKATRTASAGVQTGRATTTRVAMEDPGRRFRESWDRLFGRRTATAAAATTSTRKVG